MALTGKGLGLVTKVSFAGEGGAVEVKPDDVTSNRRRRQGCRRAP